MSREKRKRRECQRGEEEESCEAIQEELFPEALGGEAEREQDPLSLVHHVWLFQELA